MQLRSAVVELRFQTRMLPSSDPENSTPATTGVSMGVGGRRGGEDVLRRCFGEHWRS